MIQVGTLLKLSCKLGYRLLRPNNATFRCDDEDAWDGGELAILRQKCVKVRDRLGILVVRVSDFLCTQHFVYTESH